jgi:DNA ligase-associated metallophosphoesterase
VRQEAAAVEASPQPRAPHEPASNAALALRWGGEDLLALSDRALFWPRRRTICIADLHLGKAAAFRAANIPVPELATSKDLERLTVLIRQFDPTRLVILGDLLHARSGRAPGTMAAFAAWREKQADLDILLIRGNHDVRAGDPPPDWRIRILNGPCNESDDGDLAFAHDPADCPPGPARRQAASHTPHTLCGHLHPAISIGNGHRSMRSRCFWFGTETRIGILPAFGSFTGSHCIEPSYGDRVIAIGEGDIMEVTAPIRA